METRAGLFFRRLHWAFIAQIKRINVICSLVSLSVVDIHGVFCILLVGRESDAGALDTQQFVVGSTILVRYAERMRVKPGQLYVDADDGQFVKVIHAAPVELLRFERLRVEHHANLTRPCERCGQQPTTKHCGGCQLGRYCNKQCQVSDWPAHKRTFRIWQGLQDAVRAEEMRQEGDLGPLPSSADPRPRRDQLVSHSVSPHCSCDVWE